MSGLFKYNSNNNLTPKRQISRYSFGSSFTQGDDITMDNSCSFGYRSPSFNMPLTGSTSPGQIRTLREHNEQLNALRKDNFNLKLRIYFLEEKNAEAAHADGTDSLYKQNVDLKVETEALRQELKEKQELLCEAATAMELMEQEQKKCKDESLAVIDDLQQKIQFLEMEVKELEKINQDENEDGAMRQLKTDIDAQNKIAELEEYIRQYEKKTSEMSSKLTAAEMDIRQKDDIIKSLEIKSEQMTNEIELLNKKFTKYDLYTTDELKALQNQISDLKIQMAEKECMVQMLEENLADKSAAVEKGCKTIQYMGMKTKSLEQELARLKGDDEHKPESLEDMKVLQTTTDEVEKLKAQLAQTVRESEETRQWLQECGDICTMLMGRLKELAEFLDSLLKQKGVLDVLAQERRKAMRKAVDTSLNLSRSIGNISQRFSMNESQLYNLSALSDILNISSENKENILTTKSDQKNSSQLLMIENLRAEVKSFRSEIDRSFTCATNTTTPTTTTTITATKKDRRSFSHLIDANSESETWSEPDRRVSHARIGLDDTTKLSSNKQPNSTSLSEEENVQKITRKNSMSKLMDRITELEASLSERDQKILKIQCQLVDSDNKLQEERFKSNQMCNEIKRHGRVNEQLNVEIISHKEHTEKLTKELNSLRVEMKKDFNRLIAERDACGVDLRVATMKMTALQNDFDELKTNHKNEIASVLDDAQYRLDQTVATLNEQHKFETNTLETQYEKRLDSYVCRDRYDDQLQCNDEIRLKLSDALATVDSLQEIETELQAQMIENEKTIRTLKKTVDDATLQASKTLLDRNKFVSEKLTLEKTNIDLLSRIDILSLEKSELNTKLAKLERMNALLQNKLVSKDTQYQLMRSASHGNNIRFQYFRTTSDQTSASGYTSDEFKSRMENSSPDLGIDSDNGRLSGSSDAIVRLNKSDVLPVLRLKSENTIERKSLQNNAQQKAPLSSFLLLPSNSKTVQKHDCEQAEKEIAELKCQLVRGHNAYKKILIQLQNSNERKVEIERDIRQEIWKTQNMLRNARANIENVEKSTKAQSSAKQQSSSNSDS